MSFDFRYPTPLPSTKGWGPGWPDCQPIAREGESRLFVPGVHAQVAEMLELITTEMLRKGFTFVIPGCWGFGCRGTKASSGNRQGTPSFHSWGLGVDVNAPLNVFGSDASRAQLAQPHNRWVVDLFRRFGWFWLGPDIKDWMHFSFCGSPADARAMTIKAREELDDMGYAEFERGLRSQRQGKPLPPDADPDFRLGYDVGVDIKNAAQTPKPGTPGPHEHNLEGKAK